MTSISLHFLMKIKQAFNKTEGFIRNKYVVWLIITFGVICRLSQYLFNRSFWMDEAKYALKIRDYSFLQLIQPSLHEGDSFFILGGAAPAGFFCISKLFHQILGDNEFALRLFPLVGGLLAIFLFYRLALRFLDLKSSVIALCFFSFSGALIYYSSELHQYSTDVTFALLSYLMLDDMRRKPLTKSKIILYGICGAGFLLFSYTVTFIWVGTGISIFLSNIIKKKWSKLLQVVTIYVIWATIFIIYYFGYIKYFAAPYYKTQWHHFMITFPLSMENMAYICSGFAGLFSTIPEGLTFWPVYGLLFFQGCISFLSKDWLKFLFLSAPIFLTLIASMAGLYPIPTRLILFLAPPVFIIMVEGIEMLREKFRFKNSRFTIIVAVVLLTQIIFRSGIGLFKPPAPEDVKPLLKKIMRKKQEGDVIYVYYGAVPAFRYYAKRFGIDDKGYIIGKNHGENTESINRELEGLRGYKRVWVFVSHDIKDDRKFYLSYLSKNYRELGYIITSGAAIFLYDLSGE